MQKEITDYEAKAEKGKVTIKRIKKKYKEKNNTFMQSKNCSECGKPIPQKRLIKYKKRKVKTCSPKCSLRRKKRLDLEYAKNRRNKHEN